MSIKRTCMYGWREKLYVFMQFMYEREGERCGERGRGYIESGRAGF